MDATDRILLAHGMNPAPTEREIALAELNARKEENGRWRNADFGGYRSKIDAMQDFIKIMREEAAKSNISEPAGEVCGMTAEVMKKDPTKAIRILRSRVFDEPENDEKIGDAINYCKRLMGYC